MAQVRLLFGLAASSLATISACLFNHICFCSLCTIMRYAPMMSLRGPLSMARSKLSLLMPSLCNMKRASISMWCKLLRSSVHVGAIMNRPCSSSNGLFWSVNGFVSRLQEPFFRSRASSDFMSAVLLLPFRLNIRLRFISSIGPIFFFSEPLKIERRGCFWTASGTIISSSCGMSMGQRKFSAKILLARFVLHWIGAKLLISMFLSRPVLRRLRLRENQCVFFDCLAVAAAAASISGRFGWLTHWLASIWSMVGRRDGVWTRMRSMDNGKISKLVILMTSTYWFGPYVLVLCMVSLNATEDKILLWEQQLAVRVRLALEMAYFLLP